ncbi:VOC family protein [Geodermatophilus sp. CPCC 206100]|uniref:VOC family protein n=1 Tax=Geodermatophilus sp. CPCC 206100 TaxID=3020054 RepID=UPI003B00E4A3
MITGFHTIVYSEDPPATRRFLAEVLRWPSLDAGGGWLIFKTPPSELGVHPTSGDGAEAWSAVPYHQASLMCDDIEATMADLRERGVEVRPDVEDQGYGLVTSLRVPGAGWMLLYQPRHRLAHAL